MLLPTNGAEGQYAGINGPICTVEAVPAGACQHDRIARKRRETPLLDASFWGMKIRFERPACERLRIIRIRNPIPIDCGGAANVRQC